MRKHVIHLPSTRRRVNGDMYAALAMPHKNKYLVTRFVFLNTKFMLEPSIEVQTIMTAVVTT